MRNPSAKQQALDHAEKLTKEKAEVEAVAKKHNAAKVVLLKVPLNDEYTEFAIGYIKYPEREDVSIAMTFKDTDPLRGKQIILENNWLEGDRRIIDDTETFLSACTVLDDVLAVRQAMLKKNW
ncbi:MAG: hypothetical protein Q8K66_13120 [Sediminibacterium sp.]|nr:hypothetical protein [Sediminibacterium sp.]MDP3128824.1 hypothetical protein [Sediminibacterium sp.]